MKLPIRAIVLMWLAFLAGAALSSSWWALGTFGFPRAGGQGMEHMIPVLIAAVTGTSGACLMICITVSRLLKEDDK